MPVKTISLDGMWKLKDTKHSKNVSRKYSATAVDTTDWIKVQVPGDIHPALRKAGLIPDPFLDLNTEECGWTAYRDWWYRREVKIPKSFCDSKVIIAFDGIDTYATIFLNGKKIGETSNMFCRYTFDITDKILPGQTNHFAICVHATKSIIESRDTSEYFACFYTPRIFARKAQCQFSWDWAPHLPSLGVHKNITIQAVKPGIIADTFVRTQINGKVHMLIELDEDSKELLKDIDKLALSIRISQGKKVIKRKINVIGLRNIANFLIPNPKLWWPNGYGKPDLYTYDIELLYNNKVLDKKTGTFGIKEVELIDEPNGGDSQKFLFKVNGKDIFCQGANWVPLDCFPGTVSKGRYEHLLRLTQEANFNMLRVWGGGIYEHDVFYQLCDEKGIMIWQDMMFACSDIPDGDSEFTMGLIPEFKYQVKRLRNHACIVHWCGGNEKTGSFGAKMNTGDIITHYLARGVTQDLSPDIAYTTSSPTSVTDIGNDPSSGDTHGGTYEEAFVDDIRKFRSHIDKKQAVFMSEFGLHGPVQMRSLKKFVSKDKLWPLNEVWEHHVQDNPYNPLPETFVQVQEKCASDLFHKPDSAADFVKVAGTFHAEYLYAEFQHHRRRQPDNNGALIWMLNDCWPCASWSIIDYYGLPKQVYYTLKNAAKPVVLSFRKVRGGYDVYVTHNLAKGLTGSVKVQIQTVDGSKTKHLKCQKASIAPYTSKVVMHIPNKNIPKLTGSFMYATFEYDDTLATEIFHHNLWAETAWPQPDLTIRPGKLLKKDGEYILNVKLTTKKYARCVNISTKEDIIAYFSDNFFDMIPAQSKQITIRSAKRFDPSKLILNHWLTTWD